jgi:hypothetical protein
MERWLLEAIVAQVPDEDEAEQVARRWRDLIPEMKAAAGAIQRQVREARCRCQLPPPSIDRQGRCSRCIGRRGT